MNRTTVLRRKLVYLVILLAMLVPLYMLGQPAGGGSNAGGRLTQMRHDFNIAESDLGEISPASQTMKLASLGLRGVAATLLWNKTHEYRVTHEWDRLKAAVNNIALLQPHSDKVWEFHSHNLTYNVSTEFDDYRQRYEMVREGTEFLQRGVRQNKNATRLIWYTGWFYGSKMGLSDEKTQFRRLFGDDTVLHQKLLDENIAVDSLEALGPERKPDNWLVGRLWLNKGYKLVDSGVRIRRQTPLNFYDTGPKWRIKHVEAIEKEGILDERARVRWQMADEDWTAFGNRSIPTTSPFTIKLGGLDDLIRRRELRLEEFQELCGAAYTDARQTKIDDLPEDFKEVWQKPVEDQSRSEKRLVVAIESRIQPDLAVVSRESDEKVRLRAISLVGEIADLDARIRKTMNYRTQINYQYWQTLTQAEQEQRTIDARKMIYDAEQANAVANIDLAIELYEKAFHIWAEIFDDYPILTIDDTADDLEDSIRHYMVAIDSEEFEEDFPLLSFVQMRSQDSAGYDHESYIEIRESMREDAEQRRKELEEEERKREEAAERSDEDGSKDGAASEGDDADVTAAEPETTEPETTEPETTEPETTEPETTEPETTEPEATEPEATEPEATEPETDAESSENEPSL